MRLGLKLYSLATQTVPLRIGSPVNCVAHVTGCSSMCTVAMAVSMKKTYF